ncbi:ribosomal-protein-S18-alanine acetyltransferase [Bifidobacterium saguini DSM 23967]|uniref:Ribosomal-protein-S18-alanine acetyltransferase n=2 Tax=Bifidobacterium saguini TaxID=762210 RepID=A0A087DDA8_9BIFI|nr:ribosomal protein S18-alanine N-acetyltransferase [Bifidobacterium saguini]KFI93508.1 ribosomal-protein-S18-alanine acetyltransferase [Bifidobacterium saguini DSM 23967]QTB90691.1 ribosomal protein S18-alanine N-acetyltransferase [Bifidobacterium saguini]
MLIDANKLGAETAIAAMRALEVELFGNHAWSEASVRQEIEGTGRTYVFDMDDDTHTIRGFAGYWYDGEDAEIMDVGVGKAHQRQGIARSLMTDLIERANRQGAQRMLLEVSVVNTPAIELYRSLGFERIGLRKRYYQPEGIDAYVMSLDLKPRIVGFQSKQSSNFADRQNINDEQGKEQERQS